MAWNEKKPVLQGYYWFLPKRKTELPQEPEIVRIVDYGNALGLWSVMSDEESRLSSFEDGYWWGPIQSPEMPK